MTSEPQTPQYPLDETSPEPTQQIGEVRPVDQPTPSPAEALRKPSHGRVVPCTPAEFVEWTNALADSVKHKSDSNSWMTTILVNVAQAQLAALLAAAEREQDERKHRLSLQQTLNDWQKQIRDLQASAAARQAENERLRAFIEELDDRSLDDLKEGRSIGAFVGDIRDAPDGCETHIIVTRGEFRAALHPPAAERAQTEAQPVDDLRPQLRAIRKVLACQVRRLEALEGPENG